MKKTLPLVLFLSLGVASVSPAEEKADANPPLPSHKRTTLGLYVTAKEANAKWKAAPDEIKILDVRTPEEYIYVGHPTTACNVPLMFLEYKWNARANGPVMRLNPRFTTQAIQTFHTTDTILIICRSGVRSARAVDILAEAGYKKVYNITDGFEGDLVKDPANPLLGKRAKNGWKKFR